MPPLGASNEYAQYNFCGEIRKKYQYILGEKAPYLELCFTFNIKTDPLIRPILRGTKGGLYRGILLYLFSSCRIDMVRCWGLETEVDFRHFP